MKTFPTPCWKHVTFEISILFTQFIYFPIVNNVHPLIIINMLLQIYLYLCSHVCAHLYIL